MRTKIWGEKTNFEEKKLINPFEGHKAYNEIKSLGKHTSYTEFRDTIVFNHILKTPHGDIDDDDESLKFKESNF